MAIQVACSVRPGHLEEYQTFTVLAQRSAQTGNVDHQSAPALQIVDGFTNGGGTSSLQLTFEMGIRCRTRATSSMLGSEGSTPFPTNWSCLGTQVVESYYETSRSAIEYKHFLQDISHESQ